jgi:hypothetical protein
MDPFRTMPTAALAFALGSVAADLTRFPSGTLSALCDELCARGEMAAITAALDPAMAARLAQTAVLDRAAARRRPGARQRSPE